MKTCGNCKWASVPFGEEIICCNPNTPALGMMKESTCGSFRKKEEPLICPICKKQHEIKWIAGMDKKTAELTGHPFEGNRCWYMQWCGGVICESVKYSTVESQRKAREKLVRRWNKAIREAIKSGNGQ